MTNRLGVHILRMRSMSCVNRRRLHLASSRICRTFHIKLSAKNVMRGPAVGNLTGADHTREGGAVQRFIVVPEYREREERAVRYDEMRSVNGTLLTNKLLLQ